MYPPATPFASMKGWEVCERAWFLTESEAGAGWQVRTLEGHSGLVYSVAISADGMRVVSGSTDETVKIWDVETGAEVKGLCSGEGVRSGGGGGGAVEFYCGLEFGAI